ncbi:MAG: MFS transporter [Deltaproteobacteria bacterium]|nr:MFS transporter [Deltaproteobacteria bacterium]
MTGEAKRAHPLLWVPSLYFAMGTPMIAVSVVAAIMYKNLGLSNTEIAAYTGAMYLPWVLKPLWAPLVELFRTKKFFVLAMECTMVVTFTCLALALRLPIYLPLSIAFFWIIGFASATQDIAGDGVYLTSSTEKEQALYIGVQGAFWNLGRVLVSGSLVSLTKILFDWAAAGRPAPAAGPHPAWFVAWMVVMLIIAAILAATALWHYFLLPPGSKAPDAARSVSEALRTTGDAWASFFRKPRVWMMIAVVFFYRFGEGFIEKIGPLFLIDRREVGGLGLDNMALGHINAIGTVVFVAGTLLGGFVAARLTLRRVFVLLAFCLNVPLVTYFYLSHTMPTNLTLIAGTVFVEKFGYGLGTVGMMLYMMQELSPGPYRTAHYAFATGVMALNMMLTGMVSGKIQAALHYHNFFLFVLLASIPSIALAWLAPFGKNPDANQAPAT